MLKVQQDPLADCEWEFVQLNHDEKGYVGTTPCPVTVTTKDYSNYCSGNPHLNLQFVTVILGWGVRPEGYMYDMYFMSLKEMKLWI